MLSWGGRALDELGGKHLTKLNQTVNASAVEPGSESPTDKRRGQEGNNPDHRLRSPRWAKWKRRSKRADNQEVGLEAATLQRVRNSSLVECCGADNVPGLKPTTEAVAFRCKSGGVGERCPSSEVVL